MTLRIAHTVYDELVAHARAEAPIEACGYIGTKNGLAVDSLRLTNADHSPEHFSFDPAEQFAAVRKLRKAGLQLGAVYHSHPASPARPSQEDIRLAFDPAITYIIVSLASPEPDLRAFLIRNGVVTPEPVEVLQPAQEHIMSYQIPASLAAEIDDLESLVGKFQRHELDAASFKARRVPFGCYEQRRDGSYMVRIRATGGAITPLQLTKIASLSSQYGAKAVHITTRQEFQIHDVALENVIPILRALLTVGLSTRGGGGNTVRNIIVSPDSGVDAHEVFDPSPYAFALTTKLITESDSWTLPRKLKFAFSNSAEDSAFGQFNDVGLITTIRNGVKGFKIYVAGGMGRKPAVGHLLQEFIEADKIYIVGEAVKRLFDQYGNRKNRNAARLRFLWDDLGEARFRALYQAEFDTIAHSSDALLTLDASSPQNTEHSIDAVEDTSSEFLVWKKRYTNAQPQDGLFSVLVPATLGNIENNELLELTQFLAKIGPDTVRATFGQNLRLRNIPEELLGNLYAIVQKISGLADRPVLLANSISCTGADTCKLGICLPKGALRAIERKLSRSNLDLDSIRDFRLNLSGCPNTCGQHMNADLGFYGQAKRKGQKLYPSYRIVAGAVLTDGKARLAQPIGQINAHDLPDFVVGVLARWIEKKPKFASFADYIDAEGADEIRVLSEKYAGVPNFEDDKNYYYDWGSEEIFSLVGRGIGECSAGLFDLIDVDLKAIAAQRKRLTLHPAEAEKTDALYRIVLSASRMLLVTRGIEAPTDAAVFASFLQHFIEAGLVDQSHREVIEIARAHNTAKLLAHEEAVFALANAVKQLYESMDNSLRFPAEKFKQAPIAAPSAVQERDYRGVACPMNFVKVKFNLAQMKVGEHLRVLLDDGQPIENVPRSVTQEGHKVLAQTKHGNYWSVEIEKR
jgi:sulfite reductase (ferredoxin)